MKKAQNKKFREQFTKEHWDKVVGIVINGVDYMDYNHYAQMKDSIDQILPFKETPLNNDFEFAFKKLNEILLEDHFDDTERLPREEVYHLKNYLFDGYYNNVTFKAYLAERRKLEKTAMNQ